MNEVKIKEILNKQRDFFNSGQTKSIEFRCQQLKKLHDALHQNTQSILVALKQDLNRCKKDAYLSEAYLLSKSLKYMQKNLTKFTKPVEVQTPLLYLGSTAYVQPEPYGVVLIIASWNYPFELNLNPLIGAIAAGNCAILKPSELSLSSSLVINKIISETFPPEYICVIEGDQETAKTLLEQKFDYIFFTGSDKVGSLVMQSAAKYLTPVTFELGGKSPCILDQTADIKNAAEKIVWSKLLNSGQTCLAPDYLIVHKEIKNKLIEEIKKVIIKFYGKDTIKHECYGKIINEKHFQRLVDLLENHGMATEKLFDKQNLKIAPVIIDNAGWDDPLMQEEIFGPILPIIEYEDLDFIIKKFNTLSKPLTLYIFSQDKEFQNQIINQTSSGSVCINDTIIHYSVPNLPFGGVGQSGIGKYHGKASFDTFSNAKSVFKSANFFERIFKIRYPSSRIPFWLIKKLLG